MSVRIEFDLEQIKPEEAKAVALMLNRLHFLAVTDTVASNSGDVPNAPAAPESSTVGATSDPQPEAKRRGRPRKDAQAEVPAVDPTPVQSGPAPDAAPSAEPPSQSAPAGETGPKSYTLDELRSGLQAYTGKHDLVKAKALLKSFGCDRITELAEKGHEVHRQFMKECEA